MINAPRTRSGKFAMLASDPLTSRLQATELWDRGISEQNIGDMLKACRLAAHMGGREMAAAISAQLPEGRTISHVTLHHWETNKNLPSAITFAPGTPSDAYGAVITAVDRQNSMNISDTHGRWWNPLKASTLDSLISRRRATPTHQPPPAGNTSGRGR